jgi:hypothetical protein
MRPLALALLFPLAAAAQPPDFPPPNTFPPDDATLTKIKEKTAELRQAMRGGRQHPDVLVYRVAAERIVQHHEWFTEKSAEQTLAVLEAGLERARNAAKKPWLEVRGKPVIFGYTSTVDSSVQVYAVRYPDDYDPKKAYRADVILHGRDATLTEVKFIHAKEAAKKGKPLDRFEIEIYGRGNNAYRWAGESDVFGVMGDFTNRQETAKAARAEWGVLRGFSMGGAGTWHLGLHHPFRFQALGPGAGFSTTREYIGEKKFGPQPDYVEKCLHIYDAVDYAENAFNVPVVAYSGEKDKQKLAADLIGAKLKAFKEPHSFTHLIAPGLEHKQPPEWMDKLELEYQKHLKFPRPAAADKFRFVTYTPAYAAGPGLWPAGAPPVHPFALQKQYEKAVVEGTFADGAAVVTTSNVRHLEVRVGTRGGLTALTVDGQKVEPQQFGFVLERVGGKWERYTGKESRRFKWQRQCGPIDDAFRSRFVVVTPTGQAWHDEPAAFADARQAEFARNWSKHLRGELVTRKATDPPLPFSEGVSQVLFGDPQSNPLIAEYLPSLPIKWTKDELVVNGKRYDPKTHLPVLVYPHPKSATAYVVLNSGHTFRDADFKGTNALLYPRLGDWAVLKAKPTKDDPAGFEVVDAGLFDENWQFKK